MRLPEAKSICDHAEAAETQVAEIVATGEECIRVLQERRTALISAAVTGKIDERAKVKQPEPALA